MDEVFKQLETRLPPVCASCGGALKPEVVFFGESLPGEILHAALEESRRCDLFLAIGSSLVVQPAASLPVLARENGARIVIINKEPTPLDTLAQAVFHESASEVLARCLSGNAANE